MLEKGKIYEARISDYTAAGMGVAKIDGCAVFVPNGIRGEKCLIRIENANKTWAAGKITQLLEKSPHRVNRECSVAKLCGGCTFWHMDYAEECALKEQRVLQALNRIAGEQLRSVPVLPAPSCTAYRNKAVYAVSSSKGRAYAGFFREGTHQVVENPGCLILFPEADRIKKIVIDFINHYRIRVYEESTHSGLVRHIFVRKGWISGQILVCLTVNGQKLPHQEDLIKRLKAISGFRTLVLSVNTKPGNTVLGDKEQILFGPGYIEDTLCGLSFRLSARSFYQVNHPQAQLLYQAAIAQAGITKNDTVLDLYCGVGTITLIMAKSAGRVIGVEAVDAAVSDARDNALRNGIQNAEFFCADAGKAALEMEEKGIRPDVAVVDPPRKGLNADAIEALHRMAPRKIVYVSCDPATLARDVQLLKQRGYRLMSAQAVDLFPRTAHIESIVCLCKEDPLPVQHQMKLDPEPFALIRSGKKTIELRLYDEKRQKIKPGDTIAFTNPCTGDALQATVKALHRFESYLQLYQHLPLLQCGYTPENVNTAHPSDMAQYYSEEAQSKYGVVGIELSLL